MDRGSLVAPGGNSAWDAAHWQRQDQMDPRRNRTRHANSSRSWQRGEFQVSDTAHIKRSPRFCELDVAPGLETLEITGASLVESLDRRIGVALLSSPGTGVRSDPYDRGTTEGDGWTRNRNRHALGRGADSDKGRGLCRHQQATPATLWNRSRWCLGLDRKMHAAATVLRSQPTITGQMIVAPRTPPIFCAVRTVDCGRLAHRSSPAERSTLARQIESVADGKMVARGQLRAQKLGAPGNHFQAPLIGVTRPVIGARLHA